MSEHFERALADWREARAAYTLYLHDAYEKAAEACRDALVNARGRALGIDPLSLFMGNRARAYAYASEELVEWWDTHPRMPFVEFERSWIKQRDAEIEAEIEGRVREAEHWDYVEREELRSLDEGSTW